MSTMMRKKRRLVAMGYLTAVGALLVAQASSARADSDVLVSFTYYVAKKKSDPGIYNTGWVNK
jgi:hypothetical protein